MAYLKSLLPYPPSCRKTGTKQSACKGARHMVGKALPRFVFFGPPFILALKESVNFPFYFI